jgi:hypothetical protein
LANAAEPRSPISSPLHRAKMTPRLGFGPVAVVDAVFFAGASKGVAAFSGAEVVVVGTECHPFVGLAGDAGDDVAIGFFDVFNAGDEADFYAWNSECAFDVWVFLIEAVLDGLEVFACEFENPLCHFAADAQGREAAVGAGAVARKGEEFSGIW